MARRVIPQLIDDIDGTVLEPGNGATIEFAFDGKRYEIDLTEENAQQFREALAPYIDAARTLSTSRGAARTPKPASKTNLDDVRAWARENGHTVSDRGRIPAAVQSAYDAAHS